MSNLIKNMDPNNREGIKILEITLMQWEFFGHIYCEIGGNCMGRDILGFADFECDDFLESKKDFVLRYDEDSDYFEYVLHDENGNTLEGEAEAEEMNEMIVSLRLVEKIPDNCN